MDDGERSGVPEIRGSADQQSDLVCLRGPRPGPGRRPHVWPLAGLAPGDDTRVAGFSTAPRVRGKRSGHHFFTSFVDAAFS